MKNVLAPIFLLIVSQPVIAGIDFFNCEVTNVVEISTDGRQIVQDTEFLKGLVGTNFSVERSNGAIRGSYFINNQYSKTATVINEPKEEVYQVISEGHGIIYQQVDLLTIRNHFDGPDKPFTYTINTVTYFGFCN